MIYQQSLETEQEVLETIMHFGNHKNLRVQKAMLKLSYECFYNPDTREIFKLIAECFKKQQPFHFVDILTLLPKNNIELSIHMRNLVDNYGKMHAGESNFEHYVERLVTLMCLRKQIALSRDMIESVRNCSDPENAQNIFLDSLQEISAINFRQSKDGISNGELADLFYDGHLSEDLIHHTTWRPLNAANNGGIMAKSLITIAAGAGVGKTCFSIFLLDAIARLQPESQALFFSLEMEARQIWMRHVGVCAGKPFDKLTETERLNAIAKSMTVPLQIYDTAMCKKTSDIDFIETTARIRAMDKKISVLVVDYLGLVKCKGKFENNALMQLEINSRLADLAIELDCIVISLTQVNRSPSARSSDDRCPYPNDASGSSGSYFSSTLWLGVDRPELYLDDPSYRDLFVIKCRKNRFGGIFELNLNFNEGTFAESIVLPFKKPIPYPASLDKALFSPHSKDFAAKGYVD